MSNYRGILVDSGQYRVISSNISFKHVIHFTPPSNKDELAKYLDGLWFRLGHRNVSTIIVSSRPHVVLTNLIASGLIYDLRGIRLPEFEGGLYDLVQEILNGRSTFVSKCNEIRNILASHERVRWCGAESESIFNEIIYKNATEICGNSIQGFAVNITTGISGAMPRPMNESFLRNTYDYILARYESPGQRKLGLIMCAIPRVGYNIIYVGGSPGSAWLDVLARRNFIGRVISIDPEPLTTYSDATFQVTEIRKQITSANSLVIALKAHAVEDLSNVVFIWDVRHGNASRMNDEERNVQIQKEIAILNSICNSGWFRTHVKIYQLKINYSNLEYYELPMHTRLFAQPFTLSRDVYEMRAVGFISQHDFMLTTISDIVYAQIQDYMQSLKVRLDSHETDEYNLFINFFCSIYRQCDYIDNVPLVSPDWEIALYTLNWNTTSKLSRYFDRVYSTDVKFIGSFFTKKRLTSHEHAFPEHLLLRRYPSIVFDSRALVRAKLDGLYFFANTTDCMCMDNELIFSESYLIGSTEYNLHASGQMPQYDIARTTKCIEFGYVFPKFPNSFSASEHIISPSGHAMRMFIEYANDDASLCMFVYKILSNFFRSGANKIDEELRESLFPGLSNSWLPYVSPSFVHKSLRLERADDTIWHSKSEWIIGYRAGHHLQQAKDEAVEELISFLERAITCELQGIEIFKFRQNGWQKPSPAALRLPRMTIDGRTHDQNIIKIARLYDQLRRLNISDYSLWLTKSPEASAAVLWRKAVFTLSLDKAARECIISQAYAITIDHRATSHGRTRRGLLELCLRTIALHDPSNRSWAEIPHILADDSSPNHALYNVILPGVLVRIHAMHDFVDICRLLIEARKHIDEVYRDIPIPTNFNYRAIAIELTSTRWHSEFPFARVLTYAQLANVQYMLPSSSHIDRCAVDRAVSEILDEDRFYLKRDVESNLLALARNMFP